MSEPTSGVGTPAEPQAGSVTYEEPEDAIVEEEAVAQDELAVTAPEVLADSLGDYLRAWGKRICSGESGAVPVIVGLVLIIIFFRIEQSTFLGAENLVNLFTHRLCTSCLPRPRYMRCCSPRSTSRLARWPVSAASSSPS